MAHPDSNIVKDRVDMREVAFVQQGLSEKKDGFSILEDKDNGKRLVTYVYDERTGWLICLETPYLIITAKTHSLMWVLGLVTVVVLVIAGILAYYLANQFSRPILKMQKLVTLVAGGDLTPKIEVASKDEIGLLAVAFGDMVKHLTRLISQVQESAKQLANSSQQLTDSSEQSSVAANQVALSITEVAGGTEKQSQVLNGVTTVVEQLSEDISNVANNAVRVAEQSGKAAETAQAGGRSVQGGRQANDGN